MAVMMGAILHALLVMPMVVTRMCMAMAAPGFFSMTMPAASVRMAVCVESSVSHGFFSRFVY